MIVMTSHFELIYALQSMTVPEALKLALSILRQVMEDKATAQNVELACVKVDDQSFKVLSVEDVQAILTEVEAEAAAA